MMEKEKEEEEEAAFDLILRDENKWTNHNDGKLSTDTKIEM